MGNAGAISGKTTARDMTSGPIVKQILLFAFPLMLGNIFQMLYNTVDSIVVGNFVGTQALAAVGSTTMIINMLVFFFNGFSIGAGVVISLYFGARDLEKLHRAVETTMAATFVLSILFSIVGVLGVKPMLHFMSTPEDVFDEATTYLRIYIGGISGLLIYNMGSGILRAVGDSRRPLYFLVFSAIINTVFDLVFVVYCDMGVRGVAVATILAQGLSALLVLVTLTREPGSYEKAMAAIEIASQSPVALWTITVLTINNIYKVDWILKEAEKYGFTLTFQVLHHSDHFGVNNPLRF